MSRPLLLVTALLLATLATGAWLLASASGLQAALRLAAGASGGRLEVDEASGRLIGPLNIVSLRWQTPELQLQADGLQLDWAPAALFAGKLQVHRLTLEKLHIVAAPTAEPAAAPEELLLPLAVEVAQFAIATLNYGNVLSVSDLAGRLASDGRQHQLEALQARLADTVISGEARLDGAAPLPLSASAEIAGQLAERPLAFTLQAAGPLQRIDLRLLARAGIEGEASAVLTPFAPAPFASAHIALSNIDPAAWQTGAPVARLSLSADLEPRGDGVGGRFALANPQPGPLDRQRLPLASLSGQLDWQDATAQFSELRALLPGGGTLTGSGRWQAGALGLALTAKRLDAAQIVSSLRRTRLDGPLTASLAANRQDLQLDLKDPQFALRAEVSHAAAQIALSRLELSAGTARLTLGGELSLAGEQAFNAEGKLERFDPSRFARVPAALINGSFTTRGRLLPRPLIDASFTLADSQVAGHPLTGRGTLSIDWPRIPRADVRLAAGPNTLTAQGAFGQPGEALAIVIDAPDLAPYGLEGGVTGQLALGGSLRQPTLLARLQAARLGLPDVASLRDLKLEATAGGEPASTLRVDLTVGQLSTADQPGLAKALHFQASGSNQAHNWQAGVELADRSRLSLAATGGIEPGDSSPRWRGRLLEARLQAPDPARNFRLTAPADLQLGAAAWSFGPAQLAGEPLDWRATLQAAADSRSLQASLQARGSRIGKLDGELTAGMQGAWSLDRLAPWRGSLQTDIADLGWLAELIGEGWQSAGRFSGELKLAGTPAQPLTNGRFRGEKLAVRQPAQGLNLTDGELAVDLDANLLRIRQLSFLSQLQAMPRPLRLSNRDTMAALTARPGRLDVTGEMRIAGSQGSDAFLDFRLERLGAFQLPEQWVMVSGAGRLRWNGESFGASGQLTVDAGYWQLAPAGIPRLSDDVVIRRAGDVASPIILRPKLELDISTDLGRNFLFSGAGLTSRLSGDLRLRASGRDLPRASGSIRLREGLFEAYGQQLAISRGILTFQGLLDNPGLDVLAVRRGLAVEPGVQISGTAQRPVIRLVSDPELPEAEKLAWLVLGHGSESMGAGDATLLLSAAGGLLGNDSGNVVQQLKKTFRIDEFGVRQGELGGTGTRQAGSRVAGSSNVDTTTTGSQILSIGKRLGTNVLLSYEQALGRAEGIVKLTVNLNRQISVIGRAGSDNAIDIFYTLSFGRPAEIRRPLPDSDK